MAPLPRYPISSLPHYPITPLSTPLPHHLRGACLQMAPSSAAAPSLSSHLGEGGARGPAASSDCSSTPGQLREYTPRHWATSSRSTSSSPACVQQMACLHVCGKDDRPHHSVLACVRVRVCVCKGWSSHSNLSLSAYVCKERSVCMCVHWIRPAASSALHPRAPQHLPPSPLPHSLACCRPLQGCRAHLTAPQTPSKALNPKPTGFLADKHLQHISVRSHLGRITPSPCPSHEPSQGTTPPTHPQAHHRHAPQNP